MATIVDLSGTSATFEGFMALSTPTSGFTPAFTTTRRVARIDWFEFRVRRLTTSAGVDSVFTADVPSFASTIPAFAGTWTQEDGSEAFSQLSDWRCRVGTYPSDGNGVTIPSGWQTLRFTPDFPDQLEPGGLSFGWACDEPSGAERSGSPSGVQRTDYSEWEGEALRVQVLFKGGPYLGMRR